MRYMQTLQKSSCCSRPCPVASAQAAARTRKHSQPTLAITVSVARYAVLFQTTCTAPARHCGSHLYLVPDVILGVAWPNTTGSLVCRGIPSAKTSHLGTVTCLETAILTKTQCLKKTRKRSRMSRMTRTYSSTQPHTRLTREAVQQAISRRHRLS